MELGLENKVAIVTGTGRKGAMGETIAMTLAKEGARIACVDIVQEGAEEIAKGIAEDSGVKTVALKVDQSDPQQVKDAVAKVNAELGPVDIMVNNAALMGPFGRIEKMELKDWEAMISVNLDGCYYWIREVWNTMVEKNFGRVINISSINGMVAGRGISGRHYEAAKAAIIQFTRATAVDWAEHGVTVNAICPGGFMTAPNIRWAKEHPEVIETFKRQIPMGEFGQPEDMGPLAVYLASDASRYMTGATLVIDGGYTLW